MKDFNESHAVPFMRIGARHSNVFPAARHSFFSVSTARRGLYLAQFYYYADRVYRIHADRAPRAVLPERRLLMRSGRAVPCGRPPRRRFDCAHHEHAAPRLDCVHLLTHGFDLTPLGNSGKATVCDARELLAQFMAEGVPDRGRFTTALSSLLDRCAVAGDQPAHVYGDMVEGLCQDGKPAGAIQAEQ